MSVVFPIEYWMNSITENVTSMHTDKYPCEQPMAIVVILHENARLQSIKPSS